MQGDARRCTLSFLESQPAQIVQILGEVWTRQQRPRTQRGNTRGGTIQVVPYRWYHLARVVDGGVTATGVLSRQRGNLITIVITHY
jgi:hypothetical protein